MAKRELRPIMEHELVEGQFVFWKGKRTFISRVRSLPNGEKLVDVDSESHYVEGDGEGVFGSRSGNYFYTAFTTDKPSGLNWRSYTALKVDPKLKYQNRAAILMLTRKYAKKLQKEKIS